MICDILGFVSVKNSFYVQIESRKKSGKIQVFFRIWKSKFFKNSLFCKNHPLPRVLNENIGHIWHFHNLSFLDMIKYKTSSMRPEMSVFYAFLAIFMTFWWLEDPLKIVFLTYLFFFESFLAHFRMNKHVGNFIPKVVQFEST